MVVFIVPHLVTNMIVSDPGGHHSRLVVVECEVCKTRRSIRWWSAKYKTEHVCRSCATRKNQTGRKFSKAHCEAIKQGQRARKGFKGWRFQGRGYKALLVDDPNHPRKKPYKGGSYIFEHVLVVEKDLGRYLKPHEIVHHIDLDKHNNTRDNLFLCSGDNLPESRQIHNKCHASANQLVTRLCKSGLVKFIDGKYTLSEQLENLVAKG